MKNRSPLIFFFAVLFIFTSTPGWAQNFSLGTNAPQPNYYSTDAAFVDLLMHSTPWWQMPNHNTPALTANGYPSQPGSYQLLSYTNGYPSGLYNFSGDGDFTFSVGGTGVVYQNWPNLGVVPGTLHKNGNTTTAQILINVPPLITGGSYKGSLPNTASILFNITTTNANNPPTNFRLIRPDYPPDTTALFGKEYLQAYGAVCCIRYIDWMGTINSTVSTWASRPQPNVFGCNNRATCYENMIELCNETNCDLWFCTPLHATDDWDYNMALLIKQKLKPNLHVYMELSDELWNWGGPFNPDWQQVETWDQTNSALTTNSAWARHGQEMAFLLMHHISIMQPVLGSTQFRPILAGQVANTIYSSAGLAWIQQAYGPPSNYIYAIAGAPYFGGSGNTVDALMASMNDSINGVLTTWVQQNVALAKQYNVNFVCYEVGQTLAPSSQSDFNLMSAAQYDPRMATLYQNCCTMLKNNGASLCNFYSLLGGYTQYGFWGAMEDIRQVNDGTSIKFNIEASLASGCDCGNAAPPATGGGGGGTGGSGGSGGGSSGGSAPTMSPGSTGGGQGSAPKRDMRPAGEMGRPILDP